jgi:hypothetical protein
MDFDDAFESIPSALQEPVSDRLISPKNVASRSPVVIKTCAHAPANRLQGACIDGILNRTLRGRGR